MTEIPPFEPKNLQVGDRYWEGRFPNGTGWTVLWVHEKGVLVQIGEDAEPTFLAYRYQFADGIARVKRGGVQIYPPPECPFKSGDRIRSDTSGLEFVVEEMSWCFENTGRPHWRVHYTESWDCEDGDKIKVETEAPADGYTLVPPEPAWTPHRGEFATDGTRDLFILRTDVKSNGSFSVQVFDLTYGEIDHFKPRDLKPLAPPVEELRRIITEELQDTALPELVCNAVSIIAERFTFLRRAT